MKLVKRVSFSKYNKWFKQINLESEITQFFFNLKKQ